MSSKPKKDLVYGVAAEFSTTDAILAAAEKVREAGYTHTDGFSSIPVHGLTDALGIRRSRIAGIVLIGGTIGLCAGIALQYWVSVIAYPHIVAGKPLFSWPNFVPVIFECTILGAALSAVFGMLALNKLPQPHHPMFSLAGFEKATTDKFFLCVQSTDPKFSREETVQFFNTLGADNVSEVQSDPDDVD